MPKKPQRRKITEQIRPFELSIYSLLDGKTPEQAIEQLQKIRDEYQGRDIWFMLYTWGYDGGCEMELYGSRLQTDAEYEQELDKYNKTQARKRADAQKRKDAEFAEFQRLKKKFEG